MKLKRGIFQSILPSCIVLLVGCTALAQQNTTLTFGDQKWMSRNLNVGTFANGTPIQQAKTNEEWRRAGEEKKPAWCYYNNDPANGAKYGRMYNWYAINDPRGLAPKGWHVPSDSEWKVLVEYLGGENSAGQKMKSTSGWENNGNGNNSSGFGGLPVGLRYYNGPFDFIGKYGYWWSSTGNGVDDAIYRSLYNDSDVIGLSYHGKGEGQVVRCIKDGSATTATWPLGRLTGTKGGTLVEIGTQKWMYKNLNVITFANGDSIPEAKTDMAWKKAGEDKKPAWCHYNNDPTNETKFGKMYNWYALSDPRGLAPEGWRLPTDADWTQLVDFLGGESHAGIKMKSVGGWKDTKNGNNRSAFDGIPSGLRNYDGRFEAVGTYVCWWSSSISGNGEVSLLGLYWDSDNSSKLITGKASGGSVRCIK